MRSAASQSLQRADPCYRIISSKGIVEMDRHNEVSYAERVLWGDHAFEV
jgi:hypothetical protein